MSDLPDRGDLVAAMVLTDPDTSDRVRKLRVVTEAYLSGRLVDVEQGEKMWWCVTHGSPFNDHEGACIEWLAAPDDTFCDGVFGCFVEGT